MSRCAACGQAVSRRSVPAHRRFFALCAASFAQWPESHSFQPDNSEQLRAWLICKAGYREATPIDMPETENKHIMALFRLSIEAAIKAAGGVAFVVPYKGCVAVVRPKSIAFEKLGQAEFSKLCDDVSDIIEQEIGVEAADLLKEHESAA